MIYFIDEGDVLRNGFNFYRLSNPSSIGFRFRINRWCFTFRWSKMANKFTIYNVVVPKEQPF